MKAISKFSFCIIKLLALIDKMLSVVIRIKYTPFTVFKDKIILHELKKYINEEYSSVSENIMKESKNVWVFWWQGVTDAPELISICINSMRTHLKNWELTIVDKDNYLELVELPDCIVNQFNRGAITLTHLSDIIRFQLLYKYGGLWLDATVLITSDDIEIGLEQYWTTKNEPQKISCISKARWNGAIMYTPQYHPLPKFMNKCFMMYWQYNNKIIDYFLIDYFTFLAIKYVPQFSKELEMLETNNTKVYTLEKYLNFPYDEELINKKIGNTIIHKLQRRNLHFESTETGKCTVYKFLKNKYSQYEK